MNFTPEQQSAIDKKGSNILVAAAAGSGKTAVLVERIIQKILKQNVDIDKLLVATFTNSAASEMRERVLDAIYKKLDEEPENAILQKQINLLGKSNICTIHSFCLDVIRNNFFEIDISPNCRIGAEEEIVLLKQEVLEDLFEKKYESEDEEFLNLTYVYTNYKSDDDLKNIVLKLYEFSQSAPFPKEWLYEKVEMFNPCVPHEEDFGKTIWGKIILKEIEELILEVKNNFEILKNELVKYPELDKYVDVINQDIGVFNGFENAIKNSWDSAFNYFNNDLEFDRWPVDKSITNIVKDNIKEARANLKTIFRNSIAKRLLYNSEDAYKDIFEMYDILVSLRDLVFNFDEDFKAKKKEKNLIDFNDIEHYALEVLVNKTEDGKIIPTDVAQRYREKFEEIAIDEYQDSSQIQEMILNSISNGKNIFMVGDVKQSIYKFRKACPDLFIEKYENYDLSGNEKGLKIKLFKNFRSRKNILDITNVIFENIMSKELGDIEYNKEEYLNLGADFEEIENGVGKSEVCIIDNFEDNENDETEKDEVIEEIEDITKEELESKLVAKKIREMIDKKLIVKDKKGLRKIKYKDIVILLRSTKNANIYEREFLKNNIPVFSDTGAEYLNTIEIQTIINLLKILDNPINDIALVTVLRSVLFGFTDNEIIEIRLVNREKNFWSTLLEATKKIDDEKLVLKINNFLETIKRWKENSEYLPLTELIWKIYVETGYYNYVALMPNGTLRQANLKMLFERARDYEKTSFKGLFNFIRFIEKLKLGSSDLNSAKVIGENEDVVRIMSIHKSKGLEFPVVFLCNTNKNINFQDLNGDILLHNDMGIGAQYINYERKIEYYTAAKHAIRLKMKEENISEEMRILYVALTRAKEKLIITGVQKNIEDNLAKKRENLKVYLNDEKINISLLKKYTSYLDWIELLKLKFEMSNKSFDVLDFYYYNSKDLIDDKKENEESVREIDFEKYKDTKLVQEKLEWKYKNSVATKIPIKTTVSTIKEIQNESDTELVKYENLNEKNLGLEEFIPDFMNEQSESVTASRHGTLMHLVLQKLDFQKVNSKEDIEEFIEYLVSKNFISEIEAKSINVDQIYYFINSDFALKIKQAKEIFREKPFCIKLKAKEIFEEAKEEEILVQGIIDLYCINQNGNVVLIDYKTDYVEIGNEDKLIEKYKIQLKLYKNALEQSLKRKVENVYIYSLCLNKEIPINLIDCS